MKRRQVVVERGRRAAKPKGKPSDLCSTPIETISRQTYVTPLEAAVYLRFEAMDAFYKWARKHGIPRAHRGRRLLFLRRDIDRVVQGTASTVDLIAERHQPVLRHRRAS